MGAVEGTGEVSAKGGSDGAGVGTAGVVESAGVGVRVGVDTAVGVESAGAAAGVEAAGAGVGVPAPASASAGTADNALAGKVPASAIARAAAARTIGWNFGVITPLPYLPSFARMAASSAEVTPWRIR